ncbi:MAG: glycosyltransferase family 4 protein [Armatimonadota bacterium]|nr:glycosyltransferase family 4 protein [Armatimonadota bacterium]
MRLANVLAGLARLGHVDLFVLTHDREHESLVPPPGTPVRRARAVARPVQRFTLAARLAWLVGGRLPSAFAGRDYREVRSGFRGWAAGHYDLAWLSRLESYVALAPCVAAPMIVDLDDLEDHKLSGFLGVSSLSGGRSTGARITRVLSRLQGSRNVARWRHLQAAAARSAAAVAVCSELDRQRLGAPNAVVVPNGYDPQDRPVGRVTVGDPPTLTFPGYHHYPPNADAARYLVKHIGPLVRRDVPGTQIRLVGPADARIRPLHDPPRVVVTGFVDDIRCELARADVVAVPLRYASGTRIKILEAFAHRIPVVSTTIGAEGLEVTPGRHLIVADGAERFAEGCVTLLTQPEVRRAVVEAAAALFEERYRWDHIQELVTALGMRVAAGWDPTGQHVGSEAAVV